MEKVDAALFALNEDADVSLQDIGAGDESALVIDGFYETALFHSAYTRDDFFGDRLETRRLTQTFFLRAS